jgi:hypothetical protein
MSLKIENKIKEYKKKKYESINGNNTDGSPIIFPKKIIKDNKNIISHHTSELSTLNTLSNSPVKFKHSNKRTTISNEKSSLNSVDIIGENINKVFLSLEQLIIDDNNNENKINNNNYSSSVSSNKDSYEEESKIELGNKNIQNKYNTNSIVINVPKLNFDNIFDYYKQTSLKIKVINNEPSKNNINNEKTIVYSKNYKKPYNI